MTTLNILSESLEWYLEVSQLEHDPCCFIDLLPFDTAVVHDKIRITRSQTLRLWRELLLHRWPWGHPHRIYFNKFSRSIESPLSSANWHGSSWDTGGGGGKVPPVVSVCYGNTPYRRSLMNSGGLRSEHVRWCDGAVTSPHIFGELREYVLTAWCDCGDQFCTVQRTAARLCPHHPELCDLRYVYVALCKNRDTRDFEDNIEMQYCLYLVRCDIWALFNVC